MEILRDWILGLTCAAMIAAIMGAFLPKSGGVARAGRLAAGLLLMWAAVGPLVRLDYDSLSASLSELRLQQERRNAELQNQNEEILKTLIESETAAYIWDKAKEVGAVCQVKISCAVDDGGMPYPRSARVAGELTEEQRSALSDYMAADLGIPPERQEFTKG